MAELRSPKSAEQYTEPRPESAPEVIESSSEVRPKPPEEPVLKPAAVPPPDIKDTNSPVPARIITPLQHSVEDVLAQGLESLYKELSPAEQLKFKTTGEAAAARITELIQRVTVRLAEVLQLIRQWLLTIPGINKHYLEQAAKIKADKILKLR